MTTAHPLPWESHHLQEEVFQNIQSNPSLTTEALPAGADVATGHVLAGATIHAGIGFTLIVVNVTVCPTPARVAVTLVALGKNWGIKSCSILAL